MENKNQEEELTGESSDKIFPTFFTCAVIAMTSLTPGGMSMNQMVYCFPEATSIDAAEAPQR